MVEKCKECMHNKYYHHPVCVITGCDCLRFVEGGKRTTYGDKPYKFQLDPNKYPKGRIRKENDEWGEEL